MFQDAKTASIATNSFKQWSSDTQSCTSINFFYGGYIDEGVAFDKNNPSNNHNVVTSLDTEANLESLMGQGLWPSRDLVAITLTRYEPSTGEIVDADIVLNNVVFKLEEIAPGTSCGNNAYRHDIANTLVHEVGHFIGFAHVAGQDATMFANARNCETLKRDLSMDDISGVCSVYPSSGPIVTCSPPVSGYEEVNTQAFRRQCERFDQEPIEGCDCSTFAGTRSTHGLKETVWLAATLFVMMFVRPKRRSKRTFKD